MFATSSPPHFCAARSQLNMMVEFQIKLIVIYLNSGIGSGCRRQICSSIYT